jgi:Cupin-like domain
MLRSAISIPRIAPPPKRDFYEEYVRPGRPVILTGLVDRWPGQRLWSPAYFREVYGDVRVSVAATQRDGNLVLDLEHGLNFGEMTMADYVAAMQDTASEGPYVVAEIRRFPEQFRRELVVPEYCGGAHWLRSKLWFGSKGTTTQMHRGAPENLYSVVRGQKRFVMFPPADTRRLYPHSIFSKLPNFSPVDPDVPDFARFPRLRDAQPWVAGLHDGDTLFIPTFWWHHVRTLEPTIAVNFWWSSGLTALLSAAAHLYKKARALTT